MTKLRDVLDVDLLHDALRDGYVRAQVHPTLPLVIYNYAEKAQFEKVWNPVTLTCRGLIVDLETDDVVARPFAKFFNYGQAEAPTLDLDAPAIVTDKMDGSLGITYDTPDGPAIATRGSFTSEQALHATELLRARYPGWQPPRSFTVLFEVIYPANRIVVNYGEMNDLVLLGAVEIETGQVIGPSQFQPWVPAPYAWYGPHVQRFHHRTLGKALQAPPRPNAAGLVVWLPKTNQMVKIKQDDYVALHRIVTGLNARMVWEALVASKPLIELLASLPDEFHAWVGDVYGEIRDAVDAEKSRLRELYDRVRRQVVEHEPSSPGESIRKIFASYATRHPADAWALFAQLDRKDITAKLLRNARPEPGWTPSGRIHDEDVA